MMVLVGSGIAATIALGSTAYITKASVASDWTRGSFAGTVEWTGCAHAGPRTVECAWTPYAVIVAGGSAEACGSPDRDLVWEGQKRATAGAQFFEVNDFPLDGTGEKVLCLGLIEATVAEIPCAPPGEPIPPNWHCPYQTSSQDISLAARVLEASAKPDRAPGTPDEGESPKPGTRRCHHGSRKRRGRCLRRRHHRISLSQHQKVP